MKLPEKEKEVILYDITDTQEATVSLTQNGRYRVAISTKVTLEDGEKFRVIVGPDTRFEFDTSEEIAAYLLEHSDEGHQDQFR